MTVFRGLPRAFEALNRLCLLRLLLEGDGYRYIVDDRRIIEPGVLRAVGVNGTEDGEPFDPKAILRLLRSYLVEIEAAAPKPPRSATLTKNVAWLAKTLGLSTIESDIVLFLTQVHHSNALGKLLERFGDLRTHEIHALLAIALGRPFDEVSNALRHTSSLLRSCLVWSDTRNKWGWENKIGLLNGIADQLMLAHEDPRSE